MANAGLKAFLKANNVSGEFAKTFRKMLRNMHQDRQDWLAGRAALKARIESLSENGKVATVDSGMDCDCSRWSGRVSLHNANVMSVVRWSNDFYDNAEGPQSHYLASPSDVEDMEYSSRDLALEAFEDGHAHYVTY